MSILFYRLVPPYGDFSNFSKHPIHLNGKEWKTVEHYYQAQKFAGTEHEEGVRLCVGPRAAKNMGNRRDLPKRDDWEQVKEGIMKQALVQKVAEYQHIKDLLLSSGDEEIAEHTSNDLYWGDGADGSGKNRLGVIWMEIRKELRDEKIR